MKDISNRALLSVLIIVLVAAPFIFAWHVEIGWNYKEESLFGNGFWDVGVLKMYHLQLYLLLFTNVFTAYILIMNFDKIAPPP